VTVFNIITGAVTPHFGKAVGNFGGGAAGEDGDHGIAKLTA